MPTKADYVLANVGEEIIRARKKFKPFVNAHEAYAVLKEEVDEFWDEVKRKKQDPAAMKHELIQIAAMAICGVIEL